MTCKVLPKRIRHCLFALLLFPIGACTTARSVNKYLDRHPAEKARIVEQGIKVDNSRTETTTPGPTIYVDCDSATKAAYAWQTIGGQTVYVPIPGDRVKVPVNCPPNKIITEVKTVRNLDAEKAERIRADKAEATAAKETQRADTNAKFLRWAIAIGGAWVVLKLLKQYLVKIPVIGTILKFIL